PKVPAKLAPGTARIFFGRQTSGTPAIAVEELYVSVGKSGARAVLSAGGDNEWEASLDAAGHLRPTKPRSDPVELSLYEAGTFDGEHRYEAGSKSTCTRPPFGPS